MNITEAPAAVVTVGPTVMDGTVVRWYADLQAAKRYDEIVSASRNRVTVNVDLTTPDEVATLAVTLAIAADVMSRLKRNEDVSVVATHVRPFASDRVEPVQR